MDYKELLKEITIIVFASLILGISLSMFDLSFNLTFTLTISFLIIISLNIIAKKIAAYYYESNIKTRFWSWYQYGLRKDFHFKKPVPMLWLPPILAFFTKGFFLWLGILEFDVTPRIERISRRHDLYKFTEMSEWHIALITTAGIVMTLILSIIGYVAGFETFAKLAVYYAVWSIIPIGNMDGSKVLFGSKILWLTLLIILMISLSLVIII